MLLMINLNLFLKLFQLAKLQVQIEPTILYLENWLMKSHLLNFLYSMNP